MWEEDAQPLAIWSMVTVFLAKPEGGVRPIHLLAFAMRFWSRIRQPLVAKWEEGLKDQEHFWGTASTPCDMAGVISNLVACHARRIGFAQGARLLDLASFSVNFFISELVSSRLISSYVLSAWWPIIASMATFSAAAWACA